MPFLYQTYQPVHQKAKKRKTKIISNSLFGVLAISIAVILIRHTAPQLTSPAIAVKNVAIPTNTQPSTHSVAATVSPVDTTISDNLKNAWATVARTRAGDIDIAVYNNATGQTSRFTNAAGTINTASIVKLSVAEEILYQAEVSGIALTSAQLSNVQIMIENSDNTAASTLWSQLGGAPVMNHFFSSVGASSTVAADGGYWGLTQTTSTDQLALLNLIAYPGKTLNTQSSTLLTHLMDNTEADQSWGIGYGIGQQATYGLKDGWLDDADTGDAYDETTSWTVNSVGHVTDTGVDYTIAVLTDGQTTEDYGIQTIEQLSKATWDTLLSQ